MAKQEKNTGKKSKAELAREEEKLRILAKTDETKGEQLVFTPEGKTSAEPEIKNLGIQGIENPEQKFDLYYKGIQRLLIANLPKGKQHKKSRDYIYEEKNTFLTRGKRINEKGIRGGDGRMGYISDAEEMLEIVMDWIMQNGSMVELYNTLRDLNVRMGYGTPRL
ncbi:hypothetical protein [Pedobacter sp. D749]|uniref:hypothetical protein n=1 Tax=Pedobacter sp. D749 TaxID=2856523 RepID=UPI001C56763B|nr:hypothetical protein [Pedobacter sp. D749]QXU43475.1 hypothetical protein KYH19_07795 [Pedobacter sp. D749]